MSHWCHIPFVSFHFQAKISLAIRRECLLWEQGTPLGAVFNFVVKQAVATCIFFNCAAVRSVRRWTQGPLPSPAEGYYSGYLTHRIQCAPWSGGTKQGWNSRPHLHVQRMKKSPVAWGQIPQRPPLPLPTSSQSSVLTLTDTLAASLSLQPPALSSLKGD